MMNTFRSEANQPELFALTTNFEAGPRFAKIWYLGHDLNTGTVFGCFYQPF